MAMHKYVKPVVAASAVAAYLFLLRYVAPSREPYFVLGTAVVGLVAWLSGTVPGLMAALILIPLTNYAYSRLALSTGYESIVGSPPYIAMQILSAIALGRLRHERKKLDEKDEELHTANVRLQSALANVQELGGLHNLCSECQSIQSEDGQWIDAGTYLKERTKMEFSHCICPKCAENFHAKTPGDPFQTKV